MVTRTGAQSASAGPTWTNGVSYNVAESSKCSHIRQEGQDDVGTPHLSAAAARHGRLPILGASWPRDVP